MLHYIFKPRRLLFIVSDRFPHPKIVLTYADNRQQNEKCDSVFTVNHKEVKSDVLPMDLLSEAAILASHSM